MRFLFILQLLPFILAAPHINLYFTDQSSDNNALRHHCLRVIAAVDQWNINRQILSYCITHSLPKYHLNDTNDHSTRFTFTQLSQANISSEQLYHWSTPIDLIEDYQFYLDQISTSSDPTLGKTFFYNCTLPTFGPRCEYRFAYPQRNHHALHELIHDFYQHLDYDPINLTCYMYVDCDRSSFSSCLDWSEICDGKIDCSNGGIDEEHCWELEVNECREDEYRCLNGQCIPRSFYLDDPVTPDCLDQSDEPRVRFYLDQRCSGEEPSFACADIICTDMPLTSSCLPQRTNLLVKALFSIKDANVSDECWFAFKCALNPLGLMDPACESICQNETYASIVDETCPEIVFIPAVPVLFNEVYFAYKKFAARILNCGYYYKPLECVNITRYNDFFRGYLSIPFNDFTCYLRGHPFSPSGDILPWIYSYLIPTHLYLAKYTLLSNYSSHICNRSSMYQCLNSPKCISISRLMNNIEDCPGRDDENVTKTDDLHAIERMRRHSFYCQTKEKYIPLTVVQDGKCDCGFIDRGWCEDENLEINYIKRNISFQTICDGFTELLPIVIDERNETDETDCENWICNNIYTRCDGFWNCPNGEDEIGCYQPSLLTCSFDEHLCVSYETLQLICLSIDRVNDGRIDCIGATDERSICFDRGALSQTSVFYCTADNSTNCLSEYILCDTIEDCIDGDDERFCRTNRSFLRGGSICQLSDALNLTDGEQFICDYTKDRTKQQILHFKIDQTKHKPVDETIESIDTLSSYKPSINSFYVQELRCHLGLDLHVWSENQHEFPNRICFCPPSYYGDQCQFQNQRVSLSMQFRVSSDSRQTPFVILITLVDNSHWGVIQSSEQFTYLSIRDCKVKFSVYLLYSSRPKDPNKTYSIQIDIFEKQSLTHRGSLLMPIYLPLLPVHRLSYIVDIPAEQQSVLSWSTDECDHGKCLRYSPTGNNNTFCQCHRGWTGRSCSIPHICQCAEDAVCVGVDANNRSVCVCPLHRFGPRCFLRHTACSTNGTCQNGGTCVPSDEFAPFTDKFTCICPKGYIGKRCETRENAIYLSFEPDVMSTQSVFVHFIRVINNDQPQRATTLRTIPFRQQSLLVHWSQPFHLVFVEFPTHNYYFTLAQTTYNRSTTIVKRIRPSDRCRHIRELFDDSVVQLHPLRRIKYYQVPCQRNAPDLMCFYDDIHLCLCQDHRRHRVANCFEFNHNMTFNCLGQSACQNGAECFQDSAYCPQRSMCVCPACYYGTQCQFSTTIFGLSLDAILGYHIQPHISITQQPSIVQISVIWTIVFITVGLVNGILGVLTFRNKNIRTNGCGYYLFSASIVTSMISVTFGVKFWILVLTQMQVISNRSFLSFQCRLVDYLLRCSLNMDQWLNACVAIERTVTVIKGVRFNKERSKQTAKWVIILLLIFIIISGLDDSIHRRLIDEENEDERRIWCVVSYSSMLQTYNTTMNIIHFLCPFLFNLISAVIIISQNTRRKASIDHDMSYNQILREELRQHKHLLIAPVVVVIMGLPHLIYSFASKCMKSNSNTWLFLIGYFISFVPSILTFIVFVLPSAFYKKEFRNTMTRYRRNIRRYFNTMVIGSVRG